MCTILLRLAPDTAEPVVLAANRDEFRRRPSAEPAELARGLFGGRDLRSGGTWLVVGVGGLAAITNVRGDRGPRDAPSRGELPLAALRGELPADLTPWNPFNLVIVDGRGARVVTNRGDGTQARVQALRAGCHVIDNEPFGAPSARVRHACRSLGDDPPAFAHLVAHGPPEEASLCHHGREYGTVSASVVALGTAGLRRYLHRPGMPCEAPTLDLTDAAARVLRGAPRVDQGAARIARK